MFPASAWWKWDWAFKTILFTALLPFVFRSRIQMEAALLVILCCIASNVLPFAIKSVFGGGGYGRPFGLIEINGGWGGEGSTRYLCLRLPAAGRLSAAPFLAGAVPELVALGLFGGAGHRGHRRLRHLRAGGARRLLRLGSACLVEPRRKLMMAVMMVAATAALVPLMGEAWLARISTSFEPRQEESANTRLLVWAWTIDLANHRPAGAGFNAYLGNRIEMRNADGQEIVQEGRAFHSIYFEVLGEHGWIGLAIFVAIFAVFFLDMRHIRRKVRDRPDLEWLDASPGP